MRCGAPNDDTARVIGSAMARGTINRMAVNSPIDHLGGVSLLMVDCCVVGSVFAEPFIGEPLNTGGVDDAVACRIAMIVTRLFTPALQRPLMMVLIKIVTVRTLSCQST